MARGKTRKGWLLILLIIVGVGLSVYWDRLPFEAVQPEPELTDEQLKQGARARVAQLEQAVEQGNWGVVYDMLSPRLQRQKPREEFVDNIAADEWFRNIAVESQVKFSSPTSAEVYLSYVKEGSQQFPVMVAEYVGDNWVVDGFEEYFTFNVRNDQQARESLSAANRIMLSHFTLVGDAVAQAERSFVGGVGSTAYLYPCGMFAVEQSRVRVLIDDARSVPSIFPRTEKVIRCYEESVFPVFGELLGLEDAICARRQRVLDEWEQERVREMVKLTKFYSSLVEACADA